MKSEEVDIYFLLTQNSYLHQQSNMEPDYNISVAEPLALFKKEIDLANQLVSSPTQPSAFAERRCCILHYCYEGLKVVAAHSGAKYQEFILYKKPIQCPSWKRLVYILLSMYINFSGTTCYFTFFFCAP